MKIQIKTYGKISLYHKARLSLIERFKPNLKREVVLNTYSINSYIPKLNKARALIGACGVVVCVVIPFITPLLVFPLLWGLK